MLHNGTHHRRDVRVLLVSTYSPLAVGGIGQFVHDFGIALYRRGVQVTALYRYEPPEFPASADLTESVNLVELRPMDLRGLRTLSANRQVTRWIRAHHQELDLIHGLNPMPMAAAALREGHRHGIPSVVTIYAKYPRSPNVLLRRMNARSQRILLDEGDAIVYESENTAREFSPHRGRVILNGIDCSHFAPNPEIRERMRRALSIPLDKPVVLFLGRMDRLKGIEIFLEAIRLLRMQVINFQCLLVGSLELPGIPRRIRDLGLDGNAKIIGPVGKREVRDYFCASDVFVLPSFLEGISSALIEAMACGVAPIVTTVGGNPEVVRHDIEGLHVPPGDPRRLAEAMERLLTDGDLLARFSASARQRIVTEFNLNRMTSQYLDVYRETIERMRYKSRRS